MVHPVVGSPLTRRSLLVGAGALAVAGAFGQPAAALPGAASRSVADAVGFLKTMASAYPAAGSPTLPQSYADELGLFSTAFVYDAAVAACAALAAGEVGLARSIGDGLVYAQTHDPSYSDGRLRQAYNVGPYTFYDGSQNPYGLVMADGKANVGWQFGFLGTAVGDMAWPGIALVRLFVATKATGYLDAAVRIGDWIINKATNRGTLGGFAFGRDAGDNPLPWLSTEHNIDAVAFFTMLNQVSPDARWVAAAASARGVIDAMVSGKGYLYTGSPDGSTLSTSPIPLDPQTWSWLALRDESLASGLDWARRNLATTDSSEQSTSQLPDGLTLSGVTFSDASLTSTASYNGIRVHRQGVWLEGTAQLACAYADRGRRGRANPYLAQLRLAQRELGRGQHVGGAALRRGGIVAASSLIDTGFGFGYFQIQHVGATGWYVLAELGANPMRLD